MTQKEEHELAIILEDMRNDFVKAAKEKDNYVLDVALDTAKEQLQFLLDRVLGRPRRVKNKMVII